MDKCLEKRIKDFRERMMGRDLSARYPIEFSEEGTIKQRDLSGFDNIKLPLKLLGKIMIPYTGDKSMMEWMKLEGRINPERKFEFYSAYGVFLIGKYGLIYSLLDKFF